MADENRDDVIVRNLHASRFPRVRAMDAILEPVRTAPTVVVLNVGGVQFSTSLARLMMLNGPFLTHNARQLCKASQSRCLVLCFPAATS